MFIGFIFIECSHNSIAGAHGKKLAKPYCSRQCVCDPDIRFTPVCPEDGVQTFYSPCHAGCSSDFVINGKRVFGNCSCGIDSEISIDSTLATEGACGYEHCQYYWILFQVLSAFGAMCIGSRLVGKILISIRSVLRQDTAIALGLEITVVGAIAYVPGKFAYEYIAGNFYCILLQIQLKFKFMNLQLIFLCLADVTCNFWSQNYSFCYLHDSHMFGNAVNIFSAILSLVAVILEFVILLIVRDIDLYDAVNIFVPKPIEMQPINPINYQRVNVVDNNATEVSQPLLPSSTANNDNNNSQQNAPRPISPAIQRVDSPKAPKTVMISHQSMASTPSTSSTVRYSPVYKASPEHIAELSTRLQTLNRHVQINIAEKHSKMTYANYVNPSVESDTEKESKLNIKQLESSVSSLVGLPSGSTVNSPEMPKGQQNTHWPTDRFETTL